MNNNKNNIFHETIIHKLCFIIRSYYNVDIFIHIM